jgi:hypothetical protein
MISDVNRTQEQRGWKEDVHFGEEERTRRANTRVVATQNTALPKGCTVRSRPCMAQLDAQCETPWIECELRARQSQRHSVSAFLMTNNKGGE